MDSALSMATMAAKHVEKGVRRMPKHASHLPQPASGEIIQSSTNKSMMPKKGGRSSGDGGSKEESNANAGKPSGMEELERTWGRSKQAGDSEKNHQSDKDMNSDTDAPAGKKGKLRPGEGI